MSHCLQCEAKLKRTGILDAIKEVDWQNVEHFDITALVSDISEMILYIYNYT